MKTSEDEVIENKKGSSLTQALVELISMTKPTISLLVVITAIPAIIMASDKFPWPRTILAILLGSALCSASAAVFNQLFEPGIDRKMKRTRKRSIPSGRISKAGGFLWGILLGVLGFGLLYKWATPLAAYVALAGHIFYCMIYTLILKPLTVQNIVIGGAAGAVGPLIGWAGITGTIGWPAWVLFLIITLWTPPHFWSLAIHYKEDYRAAGIPMYPVVHGDLKTKKVIIYYCLSLIPVVVSLYLFDEAGILYLLIAGGLTVKFLWDAVLMYGETENQRTMPFFHYSCFYTFGIFGALTCDRLLAILLVF